MAIVTINGPIGAGGIEIGYQVARHVNADYVDRHIFVEAAALASATVQSFTEKEQRILKLRDHIANFVQNMLERSAIAGAGGDPYFGPDMGSLLSEEYTNLSDMASQNVPKLDDDKFIELTTAVIEDLAAGGNVVIIGRASNIILKNYSDVLHVGLIAPLEFRINTIVEREHFSPSEAKIHVMNTEKARVAYFRKFFKVHPDDPNLYDLVLNMDKMSVESATEIISHSVVGFLK